MGKKHKTKKQKNLGKVDFKVSPATLVTVDSETQAKMDEAASVITKVKLIDKVRYCIDVLGMTTCRQVMEELKDKTNSSEETIKRTFFAVQKQRKPQEIHNEEEIIVESVDDNVVIVGLALGATVTLGLFYIISHVFF